jgi:hypothetical protein
MTKVCMGNQADVFQYLEGAIHSRKIDSRGDQLNLVQNFLGSCVFEVRDCLDHHLTLRSNTYAMVA